MAQPAASELSIERVADRRGLATFVDLAPALYRDDPAWVTPLRFERLKLLDRAKNPYFEHARAELWIARRGSRPVGRISAQIDELAEKRHGAGTGHFGFLEAEDDPAVFAALFAAAETWLAERGMTRALGPFNFSINEESGLLVEGFEHPPRIMTPHGRPFYPERIEALGYAKAKDLWAYHLDLEAFPELPADLRRVVERAVASDRLELRRLRLTRTRADFDLIMEIFNDAWSENWGYLPFTAREIAKLAADLRPLLRRSSCRIAWWDGEPAAFILILPDLHTLIGDLGGRLLPWGWARLGWRLARGRFEEVRCPLLGVRRRHQGRRGALMAIALIDRVIGDWYRRHGTRRGELSWILEDNEPMKAILEAIRGRHYKTYRLYEKRLGSGGPPTQV